MKKVNLLKVFATVLFAFTLFACEPTTPEGKAEKFNKMVRDAKKFRQEGKSDMAEKKEAEARGYGIKVIEEYGEKMDVQSAGKFTDSLEKIDE